MGLGGLDMQTLRLNRHYINLPNHSQLLQLFPFDHYVSLTNYFVHRKKVRAFVQDIIAFAIHHWLLSGLFVVLLILLFIEEARSKGLLGQLSPQDLVVMLNRDSAVVVDIRPRDAFQEGHIIGAVNFPQAELEKDLTKLNKFKDRPVVVVCATGQKAAEIAMKLKKQGYERVSVLSGGINSWKTAQMPLVKK
jgi:rhodanese-related sulfurtransferase